MFLTAEQVEELTGLRPAELTGAREVRVLSEVKDV